MRLEQTQLRKNGRPAGGIRRGFTLIELLVVVAIIAVLMAILLPSLSQARELAKRARCLANLHSLSVAYRSYAAEWGDCIPIGYIDTSPWSSDMIISGDGWAILGPLYKSGVLVDPNSPRSDAAKAFYCPSQLDPRLQFNIANINPWPPSISGTDTTVQCRTSYQTRAEQTWATVTFGEAYPSVRGNYTQHAPYPRLATMPVTKAMLACSVATPNTTYFGGIQGRPPCHGNVVPVAYADGSAKTVKIGPTMLYSIQQAQSTKNENFYVPTNTDGTPNTSGYWYMYDQQ